MSIHRYEMTDAEWAIIEPLIVRRHRGRPQKDIRAHMNGILWIATPEGLIRFDGKLRKRYSHVNNNQSSIPGENVTKIIEDKK